MAENEDGQEKSEAPSEKRRTDARERGQVPRSREFNTFFMMIASGAGLLMLGPTMMDKLLDILKIGFSPTREQIFDTKFMALLLQDRILESLILMAPLMLMLYLVALFIPMIVGGWNFSFKAMAFKGSKLDPLKGTKRIFGAQGLMELVKAIAKVVLIGWVAVAILMWQADSIMGLGYMPVEVALEFLGRDIIWFFILMSFSLIVVAAMDTPFQIWNNTQQLKMTKKEVKDENKNQEGSPETKSRIRRVQIEMARRRMMQQVPTADVVITNPTHYSVALRYDQESGGAPVVVAKGTDTLAFRIRAVANEHNVPILESPALARAVYYSTDLDEEIPSELYLAVAKVLAYIFSLKDKPGTDFSRPLEFTDVTIPEGFRRDN
ncbi:MAG: flagellar biosynthesis protein FlhB [Gammaproteobacteria bacterium]|nr:flagellar biosynthesis protein FlhB [Gammaproteobacteria bacterium]